MVRNPAKVLDDKWVEPEDYARYKYLLSLEGHSYWSFRLRHLLHLNSAVLHQEHGKAWHSVAKCGIAWHSVA